MGGLRVDKLRHKSEAIKEVNCKIAKAGGNISDELMGTVATLASFEVSLKVVPDALSASANLLQNLLGAYDAAQIHLVALKTMVNTRGGLLNLKHNDGLVRSIIG